MSTVIGSPPALDPARLERILAPLREAVSGGTLPCAVLAVADRERMLAFAVVHGPDTPRLRADSLFFLASVTKPIVATAVMRLVDDGLVDLHAPIARYVPAFRGPGLDRVTAWHVLTHTSGIPDQDPGVFRRRRPTPADMLDLVCRTPLAFEPGTRYRYCSSSFYLLAELLSRFSGLPFTDALREAVMDPVGMHDTSFDPRYDRPRIMPVEGIALRNRVVQELVLRFLANAAIPGGGLWGTAPDLVAFGQALLRAEAGEAGAILSREALLEMTREHTAGILEMRDDGTTRDPHYALGWGKPRPDGLAPTAGGGSATVVQALPSSEGAFTHGGASGTRLWVDPGRDLVFVFLTNLWDAPDAPMYAALAEVYAALGDAG